LLEDIKMNLSPSRGEIRNISKRGTLISNSKAKQKFSRDASSEEDRDIQYVGSLSPYDLLPQLPENKNVKVSCLSKRLSPRNN
jgi:hypothetical protein